MQDGREKDREKVHLQKSQNTTHYNLSHAWQYCPVHPLLNIDRVKGVIWNGESKAVSLTSYKHISRRKVAV